MSIQMSEAELRAIVARSVAHAMGLVDDARSRVGRNGRGAGGTDVGVQATVVEPCIGANPCDGIDGAFLPLEQSEVNAGVGSTHSGESQEEARCEDVQMPVFGRPVSPAVGSLSFGSISGGSDYQDAGFECGVEAQCGDDGRSLSDKEAVVASDGSQGVDVPVVGKFFSEYVRNIRVARVVAFIETKMGIVLPRAAWEDLSLATYTLATLPPAFAEGTRRHKGLAVLGDLALSLVVVEAELKKNTSIASAQAVKTSLLTNHHMILSCVGSGLSKLLVYGAGVSPSSAKTTADGLEAVAGVIYKSCGLPGVVKFASYMQLM